MSRILLCAILMIHSLFSVNFIFANAAIGTNGEISSSLNTSKNTNATVVDTANVSTTNNTQSPSYNTSVGTSNGSTATIDCIDSTQSNILGITTECLRTGNIGMKHIPIMIASAVEYLMALAGSIAVVALIYHAVRMQLASGITGDSSGVDKAKRGMKGAGLGFILAMSAWFIMTRIVELLSSI